ncbi:hypothetical protein EDB19DRAFT_2042240, partial [Suillus lakei]
KYSLVSNLCVSQLRCLRSAAGATALKTPPHGINSAFGLKSTSLAVEHTSKLCRSEAGILEKVYDIAENEPEVAGHIPDVVWFHKFEGTSTAKIGRSLGIQDANAERNSRILNIIVFRKLLPITSLSGVEFLHAWWH